MLLKGFHFETLDEVKRKSMKQLNNLTRNDLQRCVQQWKIPMEQYMNRERDYIKGDNFAIV